MSDVVATTNQARSKRVEMVVRQLEALPTLPVVAAKLLRATTARDTSVRDIVSMIESDQSLTAKILALSRRAHLGLGNSVTTVEKAVVMMGLEAVRNAVLSIQVFETFSGGTDERPADADAFDRTEFWKHSLAVACTAQLIVQQIKKTRLDADEVFVCGLLHDIGKIVFDFCLPKSFARVVKVAEVNRASIADVERRILGIDHAAIGKKLAQQWQLPDAIMHSIWLHHHQSAMLPASIKYRDLIDVIHLADLIAREQRIGFSGNYVFSDQSKTLATAIGLDDAGYQRVVMDLRTRMSQRATMIGLDDLKAEDLYQQAMQLANTELGKLNETLAATNARLKARTKYFDAIVSLNQKLSANMGVMDMLERMAEGIRAAIDVESLVIYRYNRENGYVESTLVRNGEFDSQIFDVPTPMELASNAEHDGFLAMPAAQLRPMTLHYASRLGGTTMRQISLISSGALLGGVIVCCEQAQIDRLMQDRKEIEAVTTACSLILAQSLIGESKEHLAEELLAMNVQKKELEKKLVDTRTLAALGELAAGAAHELNNPLAIISGRAQLIRDGETDVDRRRPLDVIIEQAHNASNIITELMEFAKPVTPQRVVLSLDSTVDKIVDQICQKRGLNRRQFCVDIQHDARVVFADPGHVETALCELLNNAAEASAALSDLTVTIRSVAEDDTGHVQIRIADNGPGMTPDVLGHAMDLFYSAKRAGRQRGLGLPRAYRLMQANGGSVWLESQSGAGTTAFVRLASRNESE